MLPKAMKSNHLPSNWRHHRAAFKDSQGPCTGPTTRIPIDPCLPNKFICRSIHVDIPCRCKDPKAIGFNQLWPIFSPALAIQHMVLLDVGLQLPQKPIWREILLLHLEDSNHTFILQDSACSCFQEKMMVLVSKHQRRWPGAEKITFLDTLLVEVSLIYCCTICILFTSRNASLRGRSIHRQPPVGNTVDVQVQINHYVFQLRK